jgi:hypothetical protein
MNIASRGTYGKKRGECLLSSILSISVLVIISLAICPSQATIQVSDNPDPGSIASVTTVTCEGTVDHSDMLSWQQSSTSLHNPPLDTGGFFTVWFDEDGNPVYGWTADPALADLLGMPVPPGEVRYVAGYSASLLAGQGITDLVKTMYIGSVKENGNTVNTLTQVDFLSEKNHGAAFFNEDLTIDGAASHTTGENTMSCQFSTGECPFVPPFCEVVNMGSRSVFTQGSLLTRASSSFIPDSRSSGASMDYSVTSGGLPSSKSHMVTAGSIEAYVRATRGEGRMKNIIPSKPGENQEVPAGYVPLHSSLMTYSEQTSAEGVITIFSKDMHYRSGVPW